ncbi:MAG: signal recognition particle receptor subunit alpha, partial [Hyphomonadaceae bacterium]|nr:signal recognition particle receptor subunit alpha [Hyphomonadaceae bacterium]
MIWGFGRKKQPGEPPESSPPPAPGGAPAPTDSPGLFGKLFDGLKKSSSKLGEGIGGAFVKRKLDQAALDELEELLIASDMGAPAAAQIIAGV